MCTKEHEQKLQEIIVLPNYGSENNLFSTYINSAFLTAIEKS